MIDPATITGPVPAFAAGLITSLHCVGMCGPMACAFACGPDDRDHPLAVTSVYHLVRILAYGVIGAAAGWIGQAPLNAFHASPARFLPWLLVFFFLAMAFRLDRYLPKPEWITRRVFALVGRLRKWPKMGSAAVLGAATPFLPCGPLYMVFGLAMVMGSPAVGAEFLLAFGLGTLPLLWVTHSQYLRLRMKLSARWIGRLQQGLAFGMAVVIGLRLWQTIGGPEEIIHCPLCP